MVSEINNVGICGTFDYELHEEHYKFVEFASQFGNVIVFVTSDETVMENKNRNPCFNQWKRIENVVKIPGVYGVVKLSENADKNFETMMNSRLTHYIFGPDQNIENDKRLRKGFEEIGVEIVNWEYNRQVFTTKLLEEDGRLDELRIE
jgi:glycerol-3-phosphate cytidylyltransferase-like family protein